MRCKWCWHMNLSGLCYINWKVPLVQWVHNKIIQPPQTQSHANQLTPSPGTSLLYFIAHFGIKKQIRSKYTLHFHMILDSYFWEKEFLISITTPKTIDAGDASSFSSNNNRNITIYNMTCTFSFPNHPQLQSYSLSFFRE